MYVFLSLVSKCRQNPSYYDGTHKCRPLPFTCMDGYYQYIHYSTSKNFVIFKIYCSYSTKFWLENFWRFWWFPLRQSKFNVSNILSHIMLQCLQVHGAWNDHAFCQNIAFSSSIWRVSSYPLNFPCHIFVLYTVVGCCAHNNT